MNRSKIKKLVLTALFAALTYIATIVVQIPTPTKGYMNLGDCMVLLSAWFLGPLYGVLAGAIGSGLADVLTGYATYAPATVVIKGLMVIIALIGLNKNSDSLQPKKRFGLRVFDGVLAELFMAFGYFCYEAVIQGNGLSAAVGIPSNLIQGGVGLASALIIYSLLYKYKKYI